MKYSLTLGGVVVAVLGSIIVTFGFSESCSNEILAKITPLVPVVIGGVMSWVGRKRIGGVSNIGFKKE